MARYLIHDAKGNVITLTAAVEGGARQLRDLTKISQINLSGHGDWRHNHLRALETYLGKKPFFPYIFPDLSSVYLDEEILNLKDFNFAIFKILSRFLNTPEIGFNETDKLSGNYPWIERGREIAAKINPDISSIETISTFGKEALLGFLAFGLQF